MIYGWVKILYNYFCISGAYRHATLPEKFLFEEKFNYGRNKRIY